MAWSPEYAANRYYRRRGDTIDKGQKLVVLNTPPGHAHATHEATLRGLHYGFANSLFADIAERITAERHNTKNK
jgi:hypothetical protein